MNDEQFRDFLYDLLGVLARQDNFSAVCQATAKVQCELAKLNGRRDAAMLLTKTALYETDDNILFALPATTKMTVVRS